MAKGRRVHRDEAEEFLAEWESSGERMSDWCAARGLNWYSLNAFKGRWPTTPSPELSFVEVAAPPRAVRPMPAVYRVLVGEVAIEVEDDFDDDTVVRLVRAVARC